MNYRRSLIASSLLVLSATIFGQGVPSRLVPLQKELPRGVSLAKHLGPKPLSDIIHVAVALNPADASGLQKFADSVSNPTSPDYRHFIGPEEVGRRFGLDTTHVQNVVNYLKSQGMSVTMVGKNRFSIFADATVDQAQKAFHTNLENYSVAKRGKLPGGIFYGFTVPPSLPSSIAFDVMDISGLENINRPMPMGPLKPDQIRTLYSVAKGYNAGNQGQGRTIGISNWDGFTLANAATYVNYFKLPTPAAGAATNIKVVTIQGGSQNGAEQGEGDLDIQCTLGMAPLCNVIVYDGGGDLYHVLAQEAQDNAADIITESWGWGQLDTATLASLHTLHASMSSQGITYMAASGDSGTDISTYYYPDIEPEVLSIGGTSVTLDANNNRKTEVYWNDSYGAGGSGWVVTGDAFNKHPSYQVGTGVPTAASHPYRLVPDVSLDADLETGYFLFIGANAYQAGGTSAASPTFAGSLAGAEQQLISLGILTADIKGNKRMGRLNDLIYYLNGDPNVFYDVTTGSYPALALPDGSTATAGIGWDFVSGWGPVNFDGFVTKVASLGTVSSVTLNPSTVVGGSSSTGTVTLSTTAIGQGTTVNLSCSSPHGTLPATVVVPAGSKTATFTISTVNVASSESMVVTATVLTSSQTATLTVTPIQVSAVTITPTTIIGGNAPTSASVSLSAAALAGGAVVNLTSSDSSVAVPATVTVAGGSSSASFVVTTSGVSTTTSVTVTATYSGSTATATLSVVPANVTTVSVNPTTVLGGSATSVAGTLTLDGKSGTGGDVVSLTSSNTSAATVPATVTVASGSSTATFAVTTLNVTATQTVTLTATYAGKSVTTTLTVSPYTVSSVTLNPTSVAGGTPSTGTVTIGTAAGPSGTVVSLASSGADATVPANVTVLSGATTATFTVTTSQVNATETQSITASIGSSQQSATLTLTGASLSSVTTSPTTLVGGNTPTGTVTLTTAAPTGGKVVSLSTSNSSATVPVSVTVAAGSTTATFSVTTAGVDASGPVTITASSNGVSKTCVLTVLPAYPYTLALTPSTIVGGSGNTVSGKINLIGRAGPSGTVVTLTSSNTSAATVPATVTVPAQAFNTLFTVSTLAVTTTQTVTITATALGKSATATLTVNPSGLSSLAISPTTLVGGNSPTGTVTLVTAAPAGGAVVSLSSTSPTVKVPATVTVAAGATTATFAIPTGGVDANLTATVTASLNGGTKTASVTLLPAWILSVTGTPTTVVGGNPVAGSANLIGQAGPSGTVVTLSSSNTSVATVPSSITVAAGALKGAFTISTLSVTSTQTVTITASALGKSATVTLTVNPTGLSSIATTPITLVGGNSPSGTVTLTGPAPAGGTVVSLSSGNAKVVVPASVTVAAGATTGTFTISTLGVDSSTPVTLTATLGATSKTCTLTLQAAWPMTLTATPSTVVGGSATVVTGKIALNGRAGPSGTVVTLTSSNTSAATVPVSVTVPANALSASFTISTFAVGSSQSVTLTATANGKSVTTTLTVTP